VTNDEYWVENAVDWLLDDLDDDASFAKLSSVEAAGALAWALDGLVRNGGFEAWMESLGRRTDAAIDVLQFMGAIQHAELLLDVRRLFPSANEPDADTRLSAMATWTAAELSSFHDLNQAYFRLTKTQDLIDRYLAPFIRSHPREFPRNIEQL
jgi:hypothetical protein